MPGPHPSAEASSSDLVREHRSLGTTENCLLALSQSCTLALPPERRAVITSPEGWPAPGSASQKPQQKQQSPQGHENWHQDRVMSKGAWEPPGLMAQQEPGLTAAASQFQSPEGDLGRPSCPGSPGQTCHKPWGQEHTPLPGGVCRPCGPETLTRAQSPVT